MLSDIMVTTLLFGASFTDMVLTLIPAWISNYIHYNVWGEITNSLPNINTDEF